MSKKKKISLLILPLFVFLLSCKDDITNDENNSGAIILQINNPASYLTKGTPINNTFDPDFSTIGILGYHTTDDFAKTVNPESSFLPNEIINKSKTNSWNFKDIHYWPQKGVVSFFAYTPFASTDNGITISDKQGNNPVLSYQVPHFVDNQPDLMIAAPQINKYKEIIPLNFSHALACIGFDVSGENAPIDSIGIRGVYTKGTVRLNLSDNTPEWSSLSGVNNLFYKVGLIKNPIATNPSTNVMASNGYLMMIPQTLSEDAAIIIKFRGIDPKIIPLKKAGTSAWKAGDKYIYALKEGTYNFEVTPGTSTVNYSGAINTLNIKSTYKTQAGLIQDLGWKAEIISSTPDNKYWTSNFPDFSDPTGIKTSFSFSINPAPYTTTCREDLKLQKADSIPYSRIKDLSLINNSYTTANCYVVNAPGWYKFPCWVMGNAISNSTSTSAVNNQTCYLTSAPYLQNYLGQNITGLNDLTINLTNASPQLLWSDAPNLITNTRMSADRKYIEFYVSPETIRQGNAVIAIQKEGKIMWSWQIWVTDWILGTGNQSIGNDNPDIMPFAIGRCSAANYNYIERNIKIRFTQNISNIVRDIEFTQVSNTVTYGENSPYYQWGRKDPMLASNGLGNAQYKTCFGNNPYKISSSVSPVALMQGILNPNIFYCSNEFPDNWQTPINIKLWGDSQTTNHIWKTIYDPCPAGYQIPQLDIIFSILKMPAEFVEQPINGCKFSPLKNGVYSLFLASNGGLGSKDGSIFSTTLPEKGGYYWCNSNFYWDESSLGSKNTFLNLIFWQRRDINPVYYQVNPSASGLNVCGSVQ